MTWDCYECGAAAPMSALGLASGHHPLRRPPPGWAEVRTHVADSRGVDYRLLCPACAPPLRARYDAPLTASGCDPFPESEIEMADGTFVKEADMVPDLSVATTSTGAESAGLSVAAQASLSRAGSDALAPVDPDDDGEECVYDDGECVEVPCPPVEDKPRAPVQLDLCDAARKET